MAAKVNGQAIALTSVAAQAHSEAVDPEQLQRVIDQALLVQAAQRQHLNTDPGVQERVAEAGNSVLAQSYVDFAAAKSAPPTDADIKAYYYAHPELFEHRRLYLLREIDIKMAPQRFEEVQRHCDGAHDLSQMEQWLKDSGIAYRARNTARTTDELPLDVLPQFLRLKNGDIGVARAPEGAWVLQVVSSASLPLSLTQARPVIAEYLQRRLRTAVMTAEVQRLRDQARIEYPAGMEPTTPQARVSQAAVARTDSPSRR